MRISHAVVVTPGGIGTLLELFYTWQLMQVGHIEVRPLILLGDMWEGLVDFMNKGPLQSKLMDEKDFKMVQIASSIDDVINLLEPDIEKFYNDIDKRKRTNKVLFNELYYFLSFWLR